jgi:hypothetical protein
VLLCVDREGPLQLAGWGVELAVKKTEYLATDDAQIKASG